MKPQRIVIGTDFSPGSEAAARWVARHLARGMEIVLAHVIVLPEPPPIVGSRYPQREQVLATQRAGADKRLRDLAESMSADRIWLEVREGTAPEALAEIAAEYSANLLVVGSHGERARQLPGLGSTAEKIVHGSALAVLVVTHVDDEPVRRILVPVDDDDVAREALRWAAVVCERTAASVTTLHVAAGGVMTHALAAGAILSGTPPVTELLPPEVSTSDHWTELAVEAGIPAERVLSEVGFGAPAAEILTVAEREGADLIVMGRRARGGLRRAVLGSVTERVLREAGCNVMVVPEGG